MSVLEPTVDAAADEVFDSDVPLDSFGNISSLPFDVLFNNDPEKLFENEFVVAGPWLKRPTESHEDYQRFVLYAQQGPGRSISKLIKILEASYPHIKASSSILELRSRTHAWIDRADAWDNHALQLTSPHIWTMDLRARIEMADGINQYKRAAMKRHMEMSTQMGDIIRSDLKALIRWVKAGRQGALPQTAISPDKLSGELSKYVATEREISGLSADAAKAVIPVKAVEATMATIQTLLEQLPPETKAQWNAKLQEATAPMEAAGHL